MTSLVKAELRRLLSRRLLRGLTALALVVFSLVGILTYVTSGGPGGFRYVELTWIVGSVAMALLMLGWLVGASSIGAEWHSRSITTTLTWEPRRPRVLSAKAIALAATIFVWSLVLVSLFAAALYPAAELRGSMAGVDGAWIADTAGMFVRIAALATGGSLLGFAIATVGRNTAAAFGAGFGYLAAVEGVVRGLKPAWRDWLIGDNAGLFMIGPEIDHLGHSQAAAGFILMAYIAAGLFVAFAVFRRREIV